MPRAGSTARRTACGAVLAAFIVGTPAARAASPARVAAPDAVPTTETIAGWVRHLVALGPRATGTRGGKRAAEYVRRKLRRMGLERVHIEHAPSYAWVVKRWGLEVNGEAVDASPVLHSFRGTRPTGPFATEPDGRTAPLVDVGDGAFGNVDVHGKIVLFDLRFLAIPYSFFTAAADFYYDPDGTFDLVNGSLVQPYLSNYATVATEAMQRGAVGFVGVLADYFDSNHYRNEDYRRFPIAIPGLWVTREAGARIRALAAGGTVTTTLRLEGRRRKAIARSVVGILPGRSPETILVSSHHDSVTPGAVEDASGTASVLALARYFAARPAATRQKTLMFATFDSHFTGYQGHQAFIDEYVTAPAPRWPLVANVCLEHIAEQAEIVDGALRLTGLVEPRGILANVGPAAGDAIAQAIVDNRLVRTVVLPAAIFGGEGIPTDASFMYDAGVPVISLISGPLYLYDDADTLDKVPVRELVPVARTFIQIVEALDALGADAIRQ